MDELRLSLLAIGIVVLIAVYTLTMRTVRRRDRRHFRVGGDASLDSGGILHDYINELPPAAPRSRPRSVHDEISDEDLDAVKGLRASEEDATRLDVLYVDYDPAALEQPADGAVAQTVVEDSVEEATISEVDVPVAQADSAPPSQVDVQPEVQADQQPEPEPEMEPVQAATAQSHSEPAADRGRAFADSEEEEPVPEMLIVFFLMTRDETLAGAAIEEVAMAAGMERSLRGTYDLYLVDDDGHRHQVLGLANALEPGVFDFSDMHSFDTPGLVLYMQLPGPLPALEAFEKMLDIGNAMATRLNARLLDDSRSELNMQTIGQLRARIHDHELRMQFMNPATGGKLSPSL